MASKLTEPHHHWTPDRVRALRERLALDQAEFAEVLGYGHRVRVSEIENGKRFVPLQVGLLLDYIDQVGIIDHNGAGSGPTSTGS